MHGERRTAARRIPAADEPLCCARLRAGRELAIVDVSDAGALVESTARLLPGTHVEVHVVTREGRTLVRSRVTRASVHVVTADTLRYRAALAFERRVNSTPDWVMLPRTPLRGVCGQRLPEFRSEQTLQRRKGKC